jgi:hypothetical protein
LQKKIATISLLLLLLLTLTLSINAQPVRAAPTDLYDVFAVKEYKQWSAYNPSYVFSKPSSSVIRAMSDDAGFGDAYIFIPIDKDYLNGKKVSVSWHWYIDWSGVQYTTAQLYIVDHNHFRKLCDSGEFQTGSNIEHPISDYTNIYACSYTATCNGGWIDWRTDTSGILDLDSFSSSVVSIVIKTNDPWIADTSGLEVDFLNILDSNNNVLKEYHFSGNVFMEQTWTLYDYGLIRNPTMNSIGTIDYNWESGGTDERDLSEAVSSYVVDLFDSTGAYPYCNDRWGSGSEPYLVYSMVEYSEHYYDYSVILYKGHFWQSTQDGEDGECGISGCTEHHWGIADYEGYSVDPQYREFIKDYYIHYNVEAGKADAHKTRGIHDFIFLWTCLEGDDTRAGYCDQSNPNHAYGMIASWMDIDSPADPGYQLYEYGYANPDDNDHVFISFNWISPCYLYYGQAPDRYLSQFVYYFFYNTLQGMTVKDALDEASKFINGDDVPFGQSNLYTNNQMVWNAYYDRWDYTQMVVWGDGNHKMPI